ncbi:dTDP-glucose 4,6-dehydratase [Caldicellulosiruptoraceae bacterium PP1]
METILVTGGAGFIGCNFIRYMINKEEFKIINYDLLTYAGNLDNLKDIETHPNYVFLKGDISDRSKVNDVFKNYEINYVINFAAESHVDRSITGPDIFVKTNVLGTQILLDVAKQHNIKKFIQISTDEVYGSLGPTGYFTEETQLSPNSPYSASKASADMIARAYYKTYGLPINITRCSNNYGPYQHPEKFIPTIILNAIKDNPIPVYGDGQNIRDWLYVEDHCRAIELVLKEGKIGEIYNIGGNNEWRNIDIVKLILKILGKPENLITFVKDRPGHDRRYAIDSSKIQSELGWKPKYEFDEGIKRTVEWYGE